MFFDEMRQQLMEDTFVLDTPESRHFRLLTIGKDQATLFNMGLAPLAQPPALTEHVGSDEERGHWWHTTLQLKLAEKTRIIYTQALAEWKTAFLLIKDLDPEVLLFLSEFEQRLSSESIEFWNLQKPALPRLISRPSQMLALECDATPERLTMVCSIQCAPRACTTLCTFQPTHVGQILISECKNGRRTSIVVLPSDMAEFTRLKLHHWAIHQLKKTQYHTTKAPPKDY